MANTDTLREGLVAELTDVALAVAAQHGVKAPSVDQELELWKALARVVQAPPARQDLVAELTDAAYHVALEHGFWGSFVDLQLDLWKALCRAVSQSRLAMRVRELFAADSCTCEEVSLPLFAQAGAA